MKKYIKIHSVKTLLLSILLLFSTKIHSQTNNILLFVPHEDNYYSEYIVMIKALQASGYTVDVRSASTMPFSTYMVPNGSDIIASANSLSGSSYNQFTSQFQNLFGSPWSATWNSIPGSFIGTNGKIQDVVDMSSYDAFVIAGGTGILEYRYDGSYNSQGNGPRLISSTTVQTAAQKINDLVVEALLNGKPVLGQCHGASLPVYCRVPSTSGTGDESLGYSILKSTIAAGYPDANTATAYATLSVTLRPDDKVTVSTPHNTFQHNGNADYKVITSSDWYPQTVAHAARTLLNILQTYPTKIERDQNINVLILHGGSLDSLNCSPGNLGNDVPCNYGSTPNFPADFAHIQSLLAGNSAVDNFSFTPTSLNLVGTLPYVPTSSVSILSFLQQFNVVIFYKHWSTGVSDELQYALKAYADNGGGILALHHGLYNHINGSNNKNILVNQIFGVESAMPTWSGTLTNYNLFSTNYGHFVSTYGIDYSSPLQAPITWSANPIPPVSNNSFSYLQRFNVFDEIYNNMTFVGGQTFGRNVNQINPIFSNDAFSPQSHTSGFVKLFNPSSDPTVGRVAYFQVGERRENFQINSIFGQVVRNTTVWAAKGGSNTLTNDGMGKINELRVHISPNPAHDFLTVESSQLPQGSLVKIYSSTGLMLIELPIKGTSNKLNIQSLKQGLYILTIENANTVDFRARFLIE